MLGVCLSGGRTLELCVCKWWTSVGASRLRLSLRFHSAHPLSRPVLLNQARGVQKVDVVAGLGEEELQPAASFKTLHQPLRPTEAFIRPLGERDKFQDERQIYQLRLSYSFTVGKNGTEVTLSPGATEQLLYESPLDSQLWQIFDANKRFLGAGEAFPERYQLKLNKGEHTVILQFRHESEALLEKLQDQILLLNQKMDKPVTLDVYATFNDAFAGTGKLGKAFSLTGGSRRSLFLTLPAEDKLPKGLGPGWLLAGALTLFNDAGGKRVSQWPIRLPLACQPSNGGVAKKPASPKKKKPQLQLPELLRDTKLGWLGKVTAKEGAPVAAELIKAFPNHLPVLTTRLKKLTEKSKVGETVSRLSVKTQCECIEAEDRGEILWLSGEIQSQVDLKEMLIYCGTKTDVNLGDSASTVKQEMDRKKTALIEAIAAKGVVLADLFMEKEKPDIAALFRDETTTPKAAKADSPAASEEETPAATDAVGERPPQSDLPTEVSVGELDELYADLLKLTDASDSKALLFCGKLAAARCHYARALKLFAKANEERPSKWLDGICLGLLEKLAWSHAANYHRSASILKHPKDFRLF